MPPNSDDTVVLINVFTVEPANQQRLVDLLTRAIDGSVNRAPGFVSARLRRWPAGRRCSGDAWAGQLTARRPNYCRKFGGSHGHCLREDARNATTSNCPIAKHYAANGSSKAR
jgi:hypothetical protein